MLRHSELTQMGDLTQHPESYTGHSHSTYSFRVASLNIPHLESSTDESYLYEISKCEHISRQYHELQFCPNEGPCGVLAILQVQVPNLPTTCLLFGCDSDFNPFCLAVHGEFSHDDHKMYELLIAMQRKRDVRVTDSGDMLELLNYLQGNQYRRISLLADGVELGIMSWQKNACTMNFNGWGSVKIVRGRYRTERLRVSIYAEPTSQTQFSKPNRLYTSQRSADGQPWGIRRLGSFTSLKADGRSILTFQEPTSPCIGIPGLNVAEAAVIC